MERDYQYAKEIAQTIWGQIMDGVGFWVVGSWGVSRRTYGYFTEGEYEQPALYMNVNGYEFTGTVAVVYNIGRDVYEIYTQAKGTYTWECANDMVFCEELGAVLDGIIEHPSNMTDDEYNDKVCETYNIR